MIRRMQDDGVFMIDILAYWNVFLVLHLNFLTHRQLGHGTHFFWDMTSHATRVLRDTVVVTFSAVEPAQQGHVQLVMWISHCRCFDIDLDQERW